MNDSTARRSLAPSAVAAALMGICLILGGMPTFAQTPSTATASAVTIPEAMRANLKTQSMPIQFTSQVPVAQGMATIAAAASNQASVQVSAPTDGQLVGTLPQLGERVQAGQALLELASAQLADARAQWAMAQAKVALAQQSLSRDQALFTDGLIAKKRLETTRAEAQTAAAELQAASTRLKIAGASDPAKNTNTNLAIRAPIDGVITQRKIMPGERVMTGQALLEITATDQQWWLLAVPPAKAPTAGQSAELKIAGCPEPAPVRLMDLAVESASQLITLRAQPKVACAALRPGQITTASLWVQQTEPVAVIPIAAMTELDNQPQVFVLRGGQYFPVPVVLRGEADGSVYVSGTFQTEDQVVTSGVSRLKALKLGMGGE